MNELISKITNLSYDIFGIFLPGIVASIAVILLWAALGPLAPYWTCGIIQFFDVHAMGTSLAALNAALNTVGGVGAGVAMIIFWYFVGHLVHWLGRKGMPTDTIDLSYAQRVWRSLKLRTPKPKTSYDPALQPLLEKVLQKFSPPEQQLQWRQFFPAAKSYLARKLPTSLVSTYQNKYTFHRSVVAIGAILFWLTSAALISAMITMRIGGPSPNWGLLVILWIASFAVVSEFSSSYFHNWQLFGDTIITECYSLLCGPQDAKPDVKPESKP